jgi:flagellar secretion chaperone FliS
MTTPSQYANQYRKMAVSTQVDEANPHKLIELMLDGAIQRLRLAESSVSNGDYARKAKAASEAGAIIDALSACLDLDKGGDIAGGLAALYDYASRRLAESNVGNDAKGFAEVAALMGDVAGAWKQIRPAA